MSSNFEPAGSVAHALFLGQFRDDLQRLEAEARMIRVRVATATKRGTG